MAALIATAYSRLVLRRCADLLVTKAVASVRKHLAWLGVGAYLITAGTVANAAAISYTTTPLGGADWRYDYTVTNDSATSMEEFTVYFDHELFTNLAVAGSPVGWDSITAEPIPALSSDGFFDSLALLAGFQPGESLGGFSVTFTFAGPGVPGSQRFEFVDPQTFEVLHSGSTVREDSNVPEPGMMMLLMGACVAFAARRTLRCRSRVS